MTPARLLVLLVYAALLVGAVVLGPPLVSSLGTPGPAPDAEPARPYVASFVSDGGNCVAEVNREGATTIRDTDDGALVVFRGNVSVPDSNYVLDSPEFVAEGDGDYTADLTSSEVAGKEGRGCAAAQAGYELTVGIPGEAGRVSVTIEHDGETISRVSTGDDTADGGVGTAETVDHSSRMRDASVGTNVPMSVTIPMA